MIYSKEVEEMCPVAQGVCHGCAPIPEEGKLESQEDTIVLKNYEIAELKRELQKAEKTIEAQARTISDLKGANK